MARIDFATFKTVDRCSIRRHILEHHTKFRVIEHIEDLAETLVDSYIKKTLVRKNILNLESHVADDHRKGESLHRTGTRI